MRSRRLLILIGLALLALAAAVGVKARHSAPAEASESVLVARGQHEVLAAPPSAAPVVQQPSAPTARPGSAPAPSPPRPPQASESAIMAQLRELGSSNPARSLELAREGNRRFKGSADAPERASVIVRSLLSLGRRDEAREEALKMKKDYPDSDWTADVHRHMFVNPPTHPSERGYGKTYEQP